MENKVRCYNYDEITPDLLKEFSEGSQALEDLLTFCYNTKIETRACCIGHKKDGPQSTPYILFRINEEQKYLIENIINNLLSQKELGKHIQVEIRKENEKYQILFRFDYLEEELRDLFFKIIQKEMYEVIFNGKNTPGIYDDLFDAYTELITDKEVELLIDNNGILIRELKEAYLKIVEDETIEVREEEADFQSKIVYHKTQITNENIRSFISSKKKKDSNIRK